MTTLNANEQTIIENFKEQKSSIINNINVENTELENILRKKNDAIDTYEVVCGKIDDGIKFYRKVVLDTDLTNRRSSERELDVSNKENELNAKIAEFDIRQKVALEFLHGEEGRVATSLAEMNKSIDDSKFILESKTSEISKVNNELESIKISIQDFNDKLIAVKKEFIDLDKKFENQKNQKAQEITQLESLARDAAIELADVQSKVNAEKEKIVKPMELLAQTEAIVDAKQRNLTILLTRAQRYYKILYPGQEPII